MYENIFKRVEEKYLLSKEQYEKLFENINKYIEKDKYFETTICNIYFDNKNDELINNSMDKPIYKHKVRLRSYGIPKINGIDILKEIRKNNINTKVIMLTAKSMLEDKLIGFENGANDYITKPFHIEELIARVNAQLRNTEKNIKKDILKFGDIELNIRTSIILCTKSNETINISYRELMILEYLMNNSTQIISKEQIYDKIWGIDKDFESNNLEAYLSFVRKKLKIIDSDIKIKAIRGMGYKLEIHK